MAEQGLRSLAPTLIGGPQAVGVDRDVRDLAATLAKEEQERVNNMSVEAAELLLVALDQRLGDLHLSRKAWIRKTARRMLDMKDTWREEMRLEAEDYKTTKARNSERFTKTLGKYAESGGDTDEFDALSISQLIRLGVKPALFTEELARARWHDGGGEDEDYDDLEPEDKTALERAAVRQATRSLAFPD